MNNKYKQVVAFDALFTELSAIYGIDAKAIAPIFVSNTFFRTNIGVIFL